MGRVTEEAGGINYSAGRNSSQDKPGHYKAELYERVASHSIFHLKFARGKKEKIQ